MTTREFFKESRLLRFDDSGSIRLSEIEQNAYRNVITFEAVDVVGFRYYNYKFNPAQSFYGNCTVFEGATASRTIPLHFIRQRLTDTRNEMLWHRYTTTEVVQFLESYSELTASESSSGGAVEYLKEYVETLSDPIASAWEWVISKVIGDGSGQTDDEYIPLPVDTPHPTVVKIKCDVPCRFLLHLDSWYLVNPVVYIVGSAVDSDEPQDDGSEFPDGGGTDNPDGGAFGDGNESPLDPGSDARDKGEDAGWASGATVNFQVTTSVHLGGACDNIGIRVRNVQIINAGPPPYTTKLGDLNQAYVDACGDSNYSGYLIVDGNGTEYGPYDTTAGTFSAAITTFTVFD